MSCCLLMHLGGYLHPLYWWKNASALHMTGGHVAVEAAGLWGTVSEGCMWYSIGCASGSRLLDVRQLYNAPMQS